MKNFSLVVLVLSSILFAACSDETKETVAPVVEGASKVATDAVDAAKKIASDAAKAAQIKAKEMAKITQTKADDLASATAKAADEAKVKAEQLADQAKIKAKEALAATKSKITEIIASADDAKASATLYAKCAGCHGKDGQTKALGKSEKIAGQTVATLTASIKEYKAGSRDVSGMGKLMQTQVKEMSDADIEAVSVYITTMK